jgi:hypothetical protein
MITDARVHRHAVQHVAVGLKEREEPVVVLVALRAHSQSEDAAPRADVVAGGDDQLDEFDLEHPLHRVRDFEVASCRRRLPHTGADVSEHYEGERT